MASVRCFFPSVGFQSLHVRFVLVQPGFVGARKLVGGFGRTEDPDFGPQTRGQKL